MSLLRNRYQLVTQTIIYFKENFMSGIPIHSILPSTASTIVNFSKAVTTAGTQLPLFSSVTNCIAVLVVAKTTNTGLVFVGDSTTENDNAGGIPLAAGKGVTMFVLDASTIYVNSAVSGEGITGVYYTR